MNEDGMQLKSQALSGALSLDIVLTQLGMEEETADKLKEWTVEMSMDGNIVSGCNIVLLMNKLTNKTKKHFPNQYSVRLYTDLKDTKMYKELVDFTLQNLDPNKKKKKTNQINKLNVVHSTCSLDELKEGSIGIGVFVKTLLLKNNQDIKESMLDYWNQDNDSQKFHYMVIKKTKDGILVYDPYCNQKPYQLSNQQVVTDEHYTFSGVAIIVSKGGE